MYGFFVFLHIVVCVSLILIVLFQAGKGAGLGNLFGSGGGDQLFSAPSGSAFIRKLTTTIALLFVITTVVLTVLSQNRSSRSLMSGQGSMPMGSAPDRPAGP